MVAGVTIEPMAQLDIPRALALCRTAGWNQLTADWGRVLVYEPEGCFVAKAGDRLVGTVTTTRYGKTLAWIGMMLVDQAYQRQGIATRLMQTALDYLHHRTVACVKLDATPVGQKVYEKLGFQVEWAFHRWRREGTTNSTQVGSDLGVARHEGELPKHWLELDANAFGADRGRFLQTVAIDSLVYGDADGFGMIRPGFLASYLGPVSARASESAEAIVSALVDQCRESIFWDIPFANDAAVRIARSLEFQPVRDLTRMWLGNACVTPDLAQQYAMVDPAVG